MAVHQITIIGVGLLGGSIGLALRKASKSTRIIGSGHRVLTIHSALNLGAIDEGFTDPARAVAGSDMVVICTPVGLFESVFRQIGPALKAGCIVTDVGSTKKSIVELAEKILPKEVHFVGSHPMAGSEKRGVEYAKADLYKNAVCILTPTAKTSPAALSAVEDFWKLLEMRVTRLSPEKHDELLADVSHLPHLIAAALVAIQSDESMEISGKGFLDVTRIAGGDAELWRDILLDNAGNMRQSVARLRSELDRVMAMLEKGDTRALTDWLDQAAKKRAAWGQVGGK